MPRRHCEHSAAIQQFFIKQIFPDRRVAPRLAMTRKSRPHLAGERITLAAVLVENQRKRTAAQAAEMQRLHGAAETAIAMWLTIGGDEVDLADAMIPVDDHCRPFRLAEGTDRNEARRLLRRHNVALTAVKKSTARTEQREHRHQHSERDPDDQQAAPLGASE